MSQAERWQVAGNAPEAYEHHMVPTLFTPWAEELLTRAALQPGERVLDVAWCPGLGSRCQGDPDRHPKRKMLYMPHLVAKGAEGMQRNDWRRDGIRTQELASPSLR